MQHVTFFAEHKNRRLLGHVGRGSGHREFHLHLNRRARVNMSDEARAFYREIFGIRVRVNLLGMLCERLHKSKRGELASFAFHGLSRGKLPVYMRG
jgi:hypothetical protein